MKKSDRLKIVILGITGLLILIGTGIFIFIGQSICTMAGVGLFVIVCLGMVVVAGKKDDQTETIEEWEQGLQTALQRIAPKGKVSSKIIIQDKKQTRSWWNSFWQRSFIEAEGEAKEITRNYTLFRYMLGCNAYGSVPTKFNGGLFTFDPCHVDEKQSFTPD